MISTFHTNTICWFIHSFLLKSEEDHFCRRHFLSVFVIALLPYFFTFGFFDVAERHSSSSSTQAHTKRVARLIVAISYVKVIIRTFTGTGMYQVKNDIRASQSTCFIQTVCLRFAYRRVGTT